ncbi:hypothetical protein EDC19_0231 [Natranaerovirga hydrolytica]|uniref:Uncharacterized protein n=1 Tax=Natranaerovirga hydrolytica TaxID=680378 RepID=A0A4R1N4G2_9FIRM|nr:hypothetical protein [Natranaerovirga hydrolytica]TCK97829.1 hypothetical protein EDC19_0231 [Natranaerovirga hydrolytica]
MKAYFYEQLLTLMNQTLTIYTLNSNGSQPFSGMLITVNEDYISLLIDVGKETPIRVPKNNAINFKRTFNHNKTAVIPGIIAEIPLNKITAVLRYAI